MSNHVVWHWEFPSFTKFNPEVLHIFRNRNPLSHLTCQNVLMLNFSSWWRLSISKRRRKEHNGETGRQCSFNLVSKVKGSCRVSSIGKSIFEWLFHGYTVLWLQGHFMVIQCQLCLDFLILGNIPQIKSLRFMNASNGKEQRHLISWQERCSVQ